MTNGKESVLSKFNLLILTPDQYRADYVGCYGHETIGTSNIDRLAEEGVRFDRCYCAAPLCGPSRISFATSLRLSEHGRRNYWSCIDYKVPNIVRSLNGVDYRTGMFGKNHLFLYDQLQDAWDEVHEICLGNYDDHPAYKKSYSAFALEKDHPYNITSQLTDEAIDFMERNEDGKPFLCWVNWQDPHPAFTCPEPYASMFKPEDVKLPANWTKQTVDKPRRLKNWRVNSQMNTCSEADARRAMAMYMGQCRYVDDQIGRIMAFLEQSGQLDNTIVVFLSDHGELLGDFGVFHKLPVFYECLTRIPVIIRYPKGTVKPFVFEGLVEQVDLAPTIMDAMGVVVPQSMVGQSLHQRILRQDGTGRASVLVEGGLQIPTPDEPVGGVHHRAPEVPNSFGPGAMVTDGRYKLSMYSDDRHELYDLETDPHEMNNLYGKVAYVSVQQRMMELLIQRTLGAGVRPAGEWTGDGIDMRRNPPEGRESEWELPELVKGPKAPGTPGERKQTKARIVGIPHLGKGPAEKKGPIESVGREDEKG